MTIGEAYAFVDPREEEKSIDGFRHALGRVQSNMGSPLELLADDIKSDKLRGSALYDLARQAENDGIKYYVKATQPQLSNEAVANELGDLMNNVYLGYGPSFFSAIVYQDRSGEYIPKRE